MDISPRGLDFIKRKEGYSDDAYLCQAGVWTIGWGSTRWDSKTPVKKGDKCTPEQAERLLVREVQRVEDEIERTIDAPLTQGQFDCLVSFFYNLGIGWLNGKGHQQATFVRYINRGELDKVPSELLKFINASGKPSDGLLKRRREEVKLFWLADGKGEDKLRVEQTSPVEESMPQKVEPNVPTVTEIAKDSKTVQLSIFGLIATVLQQVWNWISGVAKEASDGVSGAPELLAPFQALLKMVGANVDLLLAMIIGGALVAVIFRRISQEKA